MGTIINIVTIGHYKKSVIVLKDTNEDIPVLIQKEFLRKTEIPMDKTTIKNLRHSILPNANHEVIIEWKDGKLSEAIVDDVVYTRLCKSVVK